MYCFSKIFIICFLKNLDIYYTDTVMADESNQSCSKAILIAQPEKDLPPFEEYVNDVRIGSSLIPHASRVYILL